MKIRLLRTCHWGLALSVLPLLASCSQQSGDASPSLITTAQAEPAPATTADTNTFATTIEIPAVNPTPLLNTNVISLVPAALADRPLPPHIRPSSPLADVVKLAQAGVDEGVVLSFITNSSSTFNLGSDEIIYLNDIGVSKDVVTAMIQRDQVLKASWANTGNPSATQVAQTGTTPPPEQPGPEQAYPTDSGTVQEAQPVNVTYNYFYDSLAPYGSWIDVEGYGRCWQPTVVVINRGWQPYCDRGHWIYTDCGWYWMSDYSWGWAPFHYGRWFRDSRRGWCWAPDRVWAPAWVSWRYSDEFCGWAPLPPAARFRPGFGFTYFDRSVAIGFDFGLRAECYSFVPWRHFYDSRPYNYRVPHQQVTRIYNNTTIINNIVQGNNNAIINRGVSPERVQALTHTDIRPVTIRESSTVAVNVSRGERLERDGRTLVVRRPDIAGNTSRTPGETPSGRMPTAGTATASLAASPRGALPTGIGDRPIRNRGDNDNGGNRSGTVPPIAFRNPAVAEPMPTPAVSAPPNREPVTMPTPPAARPGSIIVIGRRDSNPGQNRFGANDPRPPSTSADITTRRTPLPISPAPIPSYNRSTPEMPRVAPAPMTPASGGYTPPARDFTSRQARPEPAASLPSRGAGADFRQPASAPPPAASVPERGQGGRNNSQRPGQN